MTSVDAQGSSVARSSSHTFTTPSKRLDLLEAVESATPLTDRLRGVFADLDQIQTERRGQGEASRQRNYQAGNEETRRKLAEEEKVTTERVQRQKEVVSLQQEAARELAMHLQKQKELEKKRLEERITATATETRAVVETKTMEMWDSLRREMEAEQAAARQAQVCVCVCVCVCTKNCVHVNLYVYVSALINGCTHVGALLKSARVRMYAGYEMDSACICVCLIVRMYLLR
jgi:Flp pilus assembly protein TadB